MPSWNIHTALVERLFAENDPAALGIEDANAFQFGNYLPDVYVGFMVPGASLHIDYCITHVAKVSMIPVCNADLFWNQYIAFRAPKTPAGTSLVLGNWAHLVADRFYNGRFRSFWSTLDVPLGDKLRIAKQADFDLFGRGLGISRLVEATPELIEAGQKFVPYSIDPNDLKRAAEVANNITREGGALPPFEGGLQLLSYGWLMDAFDACYERYVAWLSAWKRLQDAGLPCLAAHVRVEAGLQPAIPDNPNPESWR